MVRRMGHHTNSGGTQSDPHPSPTNVTCSHPASSSHDHHHHHSAGHRCHHHPERIDLMVEVATQSDHSALATRHTNLTAVVTQLQRDLTALQARVQTIEDETEPIPAAPANRQATLDMVGSTWQTRQAEPWPGIHTPPGLTFNDNQPYIGHTEIYSWDTQTHLRCSHQRCTTPQMASRPVAGERHTTRTQVL